MRARALGVLVSGALVVAAVPVIGNATAEALQAPVSFTATAQSTYQTDGIAWAVASAQGKVFVGGRFSNVRPPGVVAGTGDPGEIARSNFVVLDAATGEPTSCQPAALLAGDPTTASVRSLAVSPDGQTLYVGGFFSTFGGSNRGSLAALDIASCTLVSGFNPAPTGMVRAIAATASTVYYGGDFTSVNTGGVLTTRLHAAAAGAVGQGNVGALLPWAPATESNATAGTNPPTYVNSPSVQALNVKPGGGEVVLGGDFERVNGVASHGIASVSDSGAGANVWVNNSIVPTTSAVKSIAVDATGFYTGNEGTGSLQFDGRLAFDWDTHAMRWRDICYGATQSVVVYQDALYSGSHAHNCSLMGEYPDGARHHLLAETLTVDPNAPAVIGNTDPRPKKLAWFPDTNDGPADKCGVTPQLWECIGPRGLAVAHTAGQDYMYVVGEFSTVNGSPQQGITRFGSSLATDAAPSTPVVVATSFVPGQVRVAWRPSLDLDNTDLTYTLQRGTSAGGPWTTLQSGLVQTSWFWDRPQMVYTDTGRTMGTTYWYRVTVTDGNTTKTSGVRSATVTNIGADLGGGNYGPSPYQTAVLGDDPELYLRYDETGDVFLSDATANRSNVVLKGTATFGTGLIASDASRAVTLTGGYGQTLYAQKLEQPVASFSLETWFATSSTRGGKIIGFGNKQDYSSSTFDKQVWITNDGRLAFGVAPGGSKQVLVTDAPASGGTAYNDGLRHHVVAVQDASLGMRLYVDGALVKSNTVKTNQSYAGYWHIGGDNLVSWTPQPTYACPTSDPTCVSTAKTSFPFTGTLDETAIYHHALTAGEVAQHFALADTVGTEVQALTPQAPTVSIGSPLTGDTVSGVVPVQVVGHTTTGTTSFAQKLELFVDGNLASTYTCPVDVYDCSTSFSWDTTGAGGSRTLTAKITSTDALTTTSTPVTVTVPLPPAKPTAEITDPAPSSVVGPGTVTVHATASTVPGSVSYPAALELFLVGGSSPVATVPCPGDTYDCSADIEWNAAGLYGPKALKVRATATDGCQAVPSSCTGDLSSAVAVSVAAPTTTTITPTKVVKGRTTVTVTGRVTVPLSGLGAVGMPVTVTATPAIGAVATKTVTSSATGAFSASFVVSNNTIFRASSAATGWYLASSTAVRQYVAGIPACTLSATTVRAGARDVMTCRLSGLPTATPVALQYLVAGKWRTLVKTTSRTGAAYIAFAIRAKGYWYLRTVIASNKTYYMSISATARVRII